LMAVSVCLVAVALSAFSQSKKSAIKKTASIPAPDKAYLQKI
jgi:cbb3-type cytochrome oxidase subunit 3